MKGWTSTSLLEGLFEEPSIRVLSSPIDARFVPALTEREAALVAKAIDKRKREFATGRHLAKEALAHFGVHDVELMNHSDRAPIWPEPVHGSISHCDTRAIVAIMPKHNGTVGIDIEHRAELKRDLWKSVFLEREIEALEAFASELRGRMALVLFSAKEALYKAQYPLTQTYMGFHELEVRLTCTTATHGQLTCTFQNDVGPEPVRFSRDDVATGHFQLSAFDSGEVVTGVHIPKRHV